MKRDYVPHFEAALKAVHETFGKLEARTLLAETEALNLRRALAGPDHEDGRSLVSKLKLVEAENLALTEQVRIKDEEIKRLKLVIQDWNQNGVMLPREGKDRDIILRMSENLKELRRMQDEEDAWENR